MSLSDRILTNLWRAAAARVYAVGPLHICAASPEPGGNSGDIACERINERTGKMQAFANACVILGGVVRQTMDGEG